MEVISKVGKVEYLLKSTKINPKRFTSGDVALCIGGLGQNMLLMRDSHISYNKNGLRVKMIEAYRIDILRALAFAILLKM